MIILFLILIIVFLSIAGFYVMDRSGKFVEDHYTGSSVYSAFRKKKKDTTCDTISSKEHKSKKG